MWNPEQYNKYSSQRNRPALELIARIPQQDYASIIDLGCGDGVITEILQHKYQPKNIVGLDSSNNMLNQARKNNAQITWQLANIATLEHDYDLVFSNAALQWLDNHKALFTQFISRSRKTIAIQMPNNFNAPSHVLLRETILENANFHEKLATTIRPAPVLPKNDYYNILATHMTYIDIWETEYLQQLDGEDAVLEWVRGTALTPIKAKLSANEYAEFEAKYGEKLRQVYKPYPNGKNLFPFSRVFMIGSR